MWGATSTGQLAARLIAIEEENLGLPAPIWDGSSSDPTLPIVDSTLPAESKRVHSLEILQNRTTSAFEIRTTRFQEVNGRCCKVLHNYLI